MANEITRLSDGDVMKTLSFHIRSLTNLRTPQEVVDLINSVEEYSKNHYIYKQHCANLKNKLLKFDIKISKDFGVQYMEENKSKPEDKIPLLSFADMVALARTPISEIQTFISKFLGNYLFNHIATEEEMREMLMPINNYLNKSVIRRLMDDVCCLSNNTMMGGEFAQLVASSILSNLSSLDFEEFKKKIFEMTEPHK